MTDTTEATGAPSQGSSGSLNDLRMPELQALAGRLGITGVSKMRKTQLVESIRERRRAAGHSTPAQQAPAQQAPAQQAPAQTDPAEGRAPRRRADAPAVSPTASAPDQLTPDPAATSDEPAPTSRRSRRSSRPAEEPRSGQRRAQEQQREADQPDQQNQDQGRDQQGRDQQARDRRTDGDAADEERRMASLDEIIQFPEPTERTQREETGGRRRRGQSAQGNPSGQGNPSAQTSSASSQRESTEDDGDDDDRTGRRRRGRDRYRDRKRRTPVRETSTDDDVEILEDDVLIPVAGILDILENYAFVRTTGYLPGASDVYVSLGQVKKASLRRGDAVTGAVRQPREGEGSQRQKFNALVRLDSVNGSPVEESEQRPDVEDLTPVHPHRPLRLETDPSEMTGRVLDLLAPIGRGQRVLVQAPRRAVTNTLLQRVAQAISANHPEMHLMVVLLGERPEEVTAMERSVAGEVIASTFDRSAADHTTAAELAIERARRLVELGQDVVVLLDSVTELARAYDETASSTRVLGAALDATSLHPVRQLLGAARAIENGGSLTLVATVRAGTGVEVDDDVAVELGGLASAEITLDGELARAGLWPAVDVPATFTRHEEAMLGEDERAARTVVRDGLGSESPRAALTALRTRLGRVSTNAELLLAASRDRRERSR